VLFSLGSPADDIWLLESGKGGWVGGQAGGRGGEVGGRVEEWKGGKAGCTCYWWVAGQHGEP